MQLKSLLFALLGCALIPAWIQAQKPAALKTQGEQAFANGQWELALDQLSRYQELKPGDISVLSKIGQAAFQLHRPEQAKKFLEFVTGPGKSPDPLNWYYLAATCHGTLEWERAIDTYKQFLRLASENHPLRAHARDQILRCVSGMKTTPNETVALIENMGNTVNSIGDELAPLPSVNHPDRLYFSAAREGVTGGRRNDEGYEDTKKGHWCSDMFMTRRRTAGWEPATPFSSLQNTARYEIALDFTDNGQVLHFYRGFTPYGGEIYTDTAGLNDEYKSAPRPFSGPMRPEEGDEGVLYFNDSVVLFASRRPGGFGGLDIWAARRFDGAWAAAVNLGPAVNSAYDETTPFVAADGKTLYFSSNRTEGIGGLDVWRSEFSPETRAWSKPVTMGIGINSPGDDAYFRLQPDGSIAYFSSNRLTDNLGGHDIYVAYFTSTPTVEMAQKPFLMFEQLTVQETAATTPAFNWGPLFYDNDRDVLGENNQKTLQSVLLMARQFPDSRMLVTVHTDDVAPFKFDLYTAIKRAEMIGKYLTSAGVAPERFLLRSAGQGFPLARNIVNGGASAIGQSLNRRIEIVPVQMSGVLPFEFKLERPLVGDQIEAAGTARLDEQNQGLLFRVEMVQTRQVLTTDALGLFTDLLIESEPGSGEYRYLAGAERSFAKAAALKNEVVSAGFPTATITAYLNGMRLSKAEAIGLIKKYPDLASYIRS